MTTGLGTSTSGIRYFGADFEHAFVAIEAAMPMLHEWLDGRMTEPGFGRLETAVGFRFWTANAGDVLRSPYYADITWPTKWSYAGCSKPEHMPPAPQCECGWYADIEVEDLIARARGFPAVSRLMPQLGVVEPPWSYLVVGKVELHDVMAFRPPPTMKISPRAEYRARWAASSSWASSTQTGARRSRRSARSWPPGTTWTSSFRSTSGYSAFALST